MAREEFIERRISKIKEALGMDTNEVVDGIFEAHRRSSCYTNLDDDWEGLIAQGFAKRVKSDDGKQFAYILTENGLQYAANTIGVPIQYTLYFVPNK